MGRGEEGGPHKNSKFKVNSLTSRREERKNRRTENMKKRTGPGLVWSTGHCRLGKELGSYSRCYRKLLEVFFFLFLFYFVLFGLLASVLLLSRKMHDLIYT